jgi:hypothetical protein
MRKLALGVLLAAGVGFAAAPAHAQGFWFGIGPFGVGVGAAPYAYDAYWGAPYRPYGYYAEPAYVYEPGYAYAPYTTYSYVPEYSYAPDYTYSTTYSYAPAWGYRSYAYAPRTTRIYTATRHRDSARYISVRTEPRHREGSRLVSSQAMRAQASVPVHHAHRRHIKVRYEMR